MDAPEKPILARLEPPPRALRVQERLDRIEVTLAPYLRGRAVIAGALAAAGVAAYRVTWPIEGHAEEQIAWWAPVLVASLAALWLWRPLLAWMARAASRGLVVVLPIGLAAFCCGIGLLDELNLPLLYILPPFAAVILPLIAHEAPILSLDTVKLEIHDRGRRRSFALEEIRSVEVGRLGRVRVNGEVVPELSGLPEGERAWIEGLLRAHVERRKAALARQGHDLAAPPPGLAEMQAARERS